MKFKRNLRITGTSLGLTLPTPIQEYIHWVKPDAPIYLELIVDTESGEINIKISKRDEDVENERD